MGADEGKIDGEKIAVLQRAEKEMVIYCPFCIVM